MEVQTTPKFTAAELKQMLAATEKEERLARQQEELQYVQERDQVITELYSEAKELTERIAAFKDKCHTKMALQADKLQSYGKMRANSKGGFQITHSSNELRIIRRRDTLPEWDERAGKGVEILKGFLSTAVKKRDVKMYEILMGFLAKNTKGDLEYSKVFSLLQHEDKFEDPRWIEGLKLLKEGYSISLKSFGYEFKEKDAAGKWDMLTLNFSSL